jgi:hypothetical protein
MKTTSRYSIYTSLPVYHATLTLFHMTLKRNHTSSNLAIWQRFRIDGTKAILHVIEAIQYCMIAIQSVMQGKTHVFELKSAVCYLIKATLISGKAKAPHPQLFLRKT